MRSIFRRFRRRPPRVPPTPEPVAGAEPDFADEHTGATFADQLPGGPERSRDPDSPKGYAGMD